MTGRMTGGGWLTLCDDYQEINREDFEHRKARVRMSEISEIEIKSMTKEQNYMRGYADGKSDALNKIRSEIENAVCYDVVVDLYGTFETRTPRLDLDDVFEIIDKYRAESEV